MSDPQSIDFEKLYQWSTRNLREITWTDYHTGSDFFLLFLAGMGVAVKENRPAEDYDVPVTGYSAVLTEQQYERFAKKFAQ